MPLSTEQLMMPRYKVIADYPGSTFKIGEILGVGGQLDYTDYFKCQKFPVIFQPLHWWHERKENELPPYIGVMDINNKWLWIAPVVKWDELREMEQGLCTISFTNLNNEYEERCMGIWGTTPATLTEYNQFINQKGGI